MKTKSFLIFTVCCLLALTLGGCGDGRVESAASKLGDDISNTVSRIESALDPDDGKSSGFPDEDEKSSIPDYESSQGGGINSGDEDIVNGTESDGSLSSDVSGLDDDSSAADDSSSERTKDL